MKIIGLTGSFGTGKSTVASIFASMGARVVDADLLAHKAITRGSAVYRKVLSVFGRSVLGRGGRLDRKKLGAIVFADKRLLKKLNAIIHPQVIRKLKEIKKTPTGRRIVVIDAPLLLEAGLAGMVDRLVVVKCSRARQFERCGRKFRMSREDILKRIKLQIPLREKVRLADFVIDNDGALSATKKQVKKAWRQIVWK